MWIAVGPKKIVATPFPDLKLFTLTPSAVWEIDCPPPAILFEIDGSCHTFPQFSRGCNMRRSLRQGRLPSKGLYISKVVTFCTTLSMLQTSRCRSCQHQIPRICHMPYECRYQQVWSANTTENFLHEGLIQGKVDETQIYF